MLPIEAAFARHVRLQRGAHVGAQADPAAPRGRPSGANHQDGRTFVTTQPVHITSIPAGSSAAHVGARGTAEPTVWSIAQSVLLRRSILSENIQIPQRCLGSRVGDCERRDEGGELRVEADA